MNDIEKYVSLYGKAASTLKNRKDWCPLAGMWFVFKNWLLLILIIFPLAEKSQNKLILFPVEKKLVSTSRNKGLAEKYMFQLKNKVPPLSGDSGKWRRK